MFGVYGFGLVSEQASSLAWRAGHPHLEFWELFLFAIDCVLLPFPYRL